MRIYFADFELDAQRFSLERSGQRLRIRPKVFDLLIYLVERRERVVSREELVAWLWGRTTVGSGSLSGLVNELRKALGEPGHGDSSIRTVHARGYQFVAEVEVESADAWMEEGAPHEGLPALQPSDANDAVVREPAQAAIDWPGRTRTGHGTVRAIFAACGFHDPPAELIDELCRFVAESEHCVERMRQERSAAPRAIGLDRPPRRMRLARSDSTSPRTRQGGE